MPLENMIQHYGYIVLLVGTFLEGETVVLAAGFAAHSGYLELPLVWLAAFAGSVTGDQLYFYLGRRRGRAYLNGKASWKLKMQRITRLLERHQNWLALGFRFLYDLRSAVPFAYGMSEINWLRFLYLNVLGGAIWAVVVGTAGYLFGTTLGVWLGEFERYDGWVLLGIVLIGGLIWFSGKYRKRMVRRAGSE